MGFESLWDTLSATETPGPSLGATARSYRRQRSSSDSVDIPVKRRGGFPGIDRIATGGRAAAFVQVKAGFRPALRVAPVLLRVMTRYTISSRSFVQSGIPLVVRLQGRKVRGL